MGMFEVLFLGDVKGSIMWNIYRNSVIFGMMLNILLRISEFKKE
jgi:hypothetical protein